MKNKILIGICIVIFLIGVTGSMALLLFPHGTDVQIVQDGIVRPDHPPPEAGDEFCFGVSDFTTQLTKPAIYFIMK